MGPQAGTIFCQNLRQRLGVDGVGDAAGDPDGKGGFVLGDGVHGRDRPFHNKIARLWRRVGVNL